MRVADMIKERLTDLLDPQALEIEDESHKHAGHAGAPSEGESHFRVAVVSTKFEGHSRVARQRMVYQALDDLMKSRIHALALSTKTPAEV